MQTLILLDRHTGSTRCSFCNRRPTDLTNVLCIPPSTFMVICQDCYEARIDPSVLGKCASGSCET